MRKKEFLEMVMIEIETIKKKASAQEIGNLDFDELSPLNTCKCIYGQMTGHCESKRAKELTPKIFYKIASDGWGNKITFRDWVKTASGKKYVTALEVYITMKGAKNKQVIQYLKGEINTLKL